MLNVLLPWITTIVQDSTYSAKLQQIKTLFYHRSYLDIFRNPELLPVYYAAYTPSRAVHYLKLLDRLGPHLAKAKSWYCLGAGAGAELISLLAAQFYHEYCIESIYLQDIGDWSKVISQIGKNCQESWPYSGTINFDQFDLTSEEASVLAERVRIADVITGLFVWNELLKEQKKQALKTLGIIIQNMRPGALLLVTSLFVLLISGADAAKGGGFSRIF